ncbi:MAG: hypothetical protein KAW09_10950 [Thermoplasmata archaeon]|nr:hypothetical protein [Thermoplasmata archaeon]
MNKAPLYILIVVSAVIVAVLAYFVYLAVAEPADGKSNISLLCTVGILVLAFIAIELLFKPHLILRPRGDEEEEHEEN